MLRIHASHEFSLPHVACGLGVVFQHPASGKSTTIKRSLELQPPKVIIHRASLSAKALAHGSGSLNNKIIFLDEYRGGKDSQLLMRLLQSEGAIAHEHTIIRGSNRKTAVAARKGTPVVISTTTEAKVFEDDETRFLSIWADESPAQNLAVIKAEIQQASAAHRPDISMWHAVFRALRPLKGDFSEAPSWLNYVAEQLPLDVARVRRDWKRFLTLLKAIALTRRCPGIRTKINIESCDYCVAYRILEPAFAASMHGVPGQELQVVKAVRLLRRKSDNVTVKLVAQRLGWKQAVTYKHVKWAVKRGFLKYAPGTRERNQKILIPVDNANTGFLPKPIAVLNENPGIGSPIRYVDPFTGSKKDLRRK